MPYRINAHHAAVLDRVGRAEYSVWLAGALSAGPEAVWIDSHGRLVAEAPSWVDVGDRILRMVIIGTIFGVAGGAVAALAVEQAVMEEVAKVAVATVVTGVGVASAEEIWKHLGDRRRTEGTVRLRLHVDPMLPHKDEDGAS